MTTSTNTRSQQIERALADYRSKPAGSTETARIPFRGGRVVEVIELPLDVPILNAHSFRIAPDLVDHPKRAVVEADPESDEAQEVVAELVRKAHRDADALKRSLLTDGQDNPGVITRGGKLINANSRCVLMRELVASGEMKPTPIRVAVLPADATNSEELGLESVLQQQQEFKDPYNLVSKLMMIQTLYSDARMTDQQIAASLREKASTIADLREVLVLMNRARSLTSTPRPISIFAAQKDQQQNWLELLRQVRELERLHGREAANNHIRSWLVAYYAGFNSVHQLRNVRGDWIQRDVLPVLEAGDGVSASVAQAARAVPDPDGAGAEERKAAATDLGLDLLGDMDATAAPTTDHAAQVLLDLIADAVASPETDVEVVDGRVAPADHVIATVREGVDAGIRAVRRRTTGANKLNRPQAQADNASGALKAAYEALEEVASEPGFDALVPALSEKLSEVQSRLEDLTAYLASLDAEESDGTNGPAQTGDVE